MIDWGFAGAIVLTGLVVVFLALIILIVFLSIMGNIMKLIGNKNTKKSVVKDKEKIEEKNSIVSENTDAINGEVIAAISAAVACIMNEEGKSKPFVIKSVRKAKQNTRSAWSMAGINENVQPF